MDYISLENYRYTWFFKHQDLPIEESTLKLIKPLAEKSSDQLWHQLISKNVNHPDLFLKEDWPKRESTWQHQSNWQAAWEADKNNLPKIIQESFDWDKNTVVYFCYHADNIIETTWDVFVKHWKNFLFLDNGPILLAKRRQQVLQFFDTGEFKIGLKPKE